MALQLAAGATAISPSPVLAPAPSEFQAVLPTLSAAPTRRADPILEPLSVDPRPAETARPLIEVPEAVVLVEERATTLPAGGSWRRDPEVSWYGPGFYGRRTACGHAYTTEIMGVAHRSLPCGTMVAFRWQGKTAVVPVIDRGPYVAGRQWDLSGGLCVYLDHCFTGPIEWRFP